MITLIIKSYLSILLPVGIGALLVFSLGLYFIFKPKRVVTHEIAEHEEIDNKFTLQEINKMQLASKEPDSLFNLVSELQKDPPQETIAKHSISQTGITITSSDISAIAGEDVLATQLDLARAYIETGRKQLAKKILEYVVQQGSDAQRSEARILLGYI